jgi:hypothetical protein
MVILWVRLRIAGKEKGRSVGGLFPVRRNQLP